MKTAISAPAPDEGSGLPNGGAPTPESMMQEAIRQAKAGKGAGVPANPRYDQGLEYGTPGLRYAVGDPATLPPNEGAKVKLSLDLRNNENLAAFTANHIAQMVGNAYYTTPIPAVVDFNAVYADFQSKLNAWLAAQTLLRDASTALEAARVQMVSNLNARGAYVQSASNGNANAIVSSGFGVRATPTPVGQLPPPTDLQLELNGTAGVAFLTWKNVPYARAYNIQCSPADTMERDWQPYDTTTQARHECTGLELGKKYAFRIAAVGGSTGQSHWSAEVVRMAA